MEVIQRELAKLRVKISIEVLQIIVCKCTKDCFRHYVQKPDFIITETWLNSLIKKNELDERYCVKETPQSTFGIKFKDGKNKITKDQVELEIKYSIQEIFKKNVPGFSTSNKKSALELKRNNTLNKRKVISEN